MPHRLYKLTPCYDCHVTNPKQGRATAVSDFSYLQSSYLLEYMMTVNHVPFEEDRVFRFHVNARILNR